MNRKINVAIAQIAPVLLDRARTTEKVIASIRAAADKNCDLVTFGETLLPAYPFWLARTDAARFEAPDQKEIHAHYLEQAVSIADGDLLPICDAARDAGIFVVLGIAERGGHTIYCTRVCIDANGAILSTHRKLMPTYEERLSWGIGDAAGLVTHPLRSFTLSALNCWENWIPLARAALYEQGTNLHVMLWPGCLRLTKDITRFVAKEARAYVISASAIIRPQDVPADIPHRAAMVAGLKNDECIYDGGACIAGPDGEWLVEPIAGTETLITAEIDLRRVYEERQNFDPAGHYSRPDVLELKVNRGRRDQE